MTLWILLIAHLIGDFMLQSADWAEKKTQKFRYLLMHTLIYTIIMAITIFSCIPFAVAWLSYVIIVLFHFIIDCIRVYADKKSQSPSFHFVSFLIDQGLHILIICILVYIFSLNNENTFWISNLAAQIPLVKFTRYTLIFIIILNPSSVFIKKLYTYIFGESNDSGQDESPSIGSIIGKLERIIIVILVLCNELSAIGFVLTAKSLARYKELSKQGFAERYLIGTLSSTAIAIITTLLLK